MSNPLIILGGLAPADRARVRDVVANATVYAEPLSGLREELADIAIHNERTLHRGTFDEVIRIGKVPTFRYWRDLETRDIPIKHYSRLPFTGLTRGTMHSLDELPPIDGHRDESLYAFDREQSSRIAQILDEEPESELAMIRKLSRELPQNARIYLGNSLPVREWDLAATREKRGFEYEANRGANGIDGQLSTFFGWCAPNANNVAIVGDLTALYDLNAPWIVPQLDASFRIVIINNRGGRIFERVATADRRLVINDHQLHFDKWGEMFGIEVTELRPDNDASRRVWGRYDELWK
jgi:2-succinyl-5-enolpyruvyl-6-hydroxy-3-cyclohexene-1-carboxylate synthase